MTSAPCQISRVPRFTGALAIGITSLAVLAMALGAAIAWTTSQVSFALSFLPTALTFSIVGGVVAFRKPTNGIGWLLLAFGLLMSVVLPAQTTADHLNASRSPSPLANWTAWWTTVSIEVIVVPLLLALLLFPTGRVATPRWRIGFYYVAVTGLTIGVLTATSDVNFSNNFPQLNDPVALLPSKHLLALYHGLQFALILGFLATAFSLAARYRSAGVVERAQLKWVTTAVAMMAAGFAILALTPLGNIIEIPWALIICAPLIAASIGIAVLRYRLFDIDRLISRSASYAVVTGLVLGLYLLVVSLISFFVEGSSSLAVAAATLAAAAAFRPVLRRVRGVLDRRFDRSKYDGEAIIHAFGTRLGQVVDAGIVQHDLQQVVVRTMHPELVGLWLRDSP